MAHNKARFISVFEQIIGKLLEKAVTDKQKKILVMLHSEQYRFLSTTQSVKTIALQLKCAESTVWDSVSALKELGFVICNGRIELTQEGKICVEVMRNKS